MKFTDFEGGTRTSAWASGGVIPAAQRGTRHRDGLIHIADWYATWCHLAGVDPSDRSAAAARLPPIDSLNMWNALSTGAATPRSAVVLSLQAVIVWPHKLVLGR